MIQRLTLLFIALLLSSIGQASQTCLSSQMQRLASATLRVDHSDESHAQLTHNNSTKIKTLIGPKAIFKRHAELMLQAQSDIFFQTWLFEPQSEMATIFARGLKELNAKLRAENRKVHVWLMINNTQIDAKPNSFYQKKFMDFLNKHELLGDHLDIHFYVHKAKFLGAFHSKAIVIDRNKALVHGANVSSKNNGPGLYDIGIEVSGDVVSSIVNDFIFVWNRHADQPIVLPGSKEASDVDSDCLAILYASNHARDPLSNNYPPKALNTATLKALKLAQRSIQIISPNLNNKQVMTEIVRAVDRGVKVEILLGLEFEALSQSIPTRGGTNLYSVKKLYNQFDMFRKRRETCRQLDIRFFSRDGKKPVLGSKTGASHAKYMTVDQRLTYFGSLNLDNQSFANSREIGLFIDHRVLGQKIVQKVFTPVFSKGIVARQCSRTFGVSDQQYYKNKKPPYQDR